MDGISGAAAVIGLVQAATQVTTALGRYVSRVKQAESSRAKLVDQIRLISAAETAISSIVESSPRSAHTEELQVMIDEWFKDDSPPNKCKRELDALAIWLEMETGAVTSKHRRWVQRIGWPAKEDKIQATIRMFEGFMPYFRDILSIKTFNLVEIMVTNLRSAEQVTAKYELLLWLDGFDCTDKHESTLRQRQHTTGDWLFKEEAYIEWRNGATTFIWLHAGAGKSVLASAVINDLLNGLADNETLAYFYCDFRNVRCTKAMEVLRSVTKQLLWNSKKDWLSSFSDLTARKHRGSGPPTDLGTLSDLLWRAAELHERPIVVVDALDECEDLPSLLDELTNLTNGHCLLFVTSRTLHAIQQAFKDLNTIPVDDRVDETRRDMGFHIKTELESRSRLKILRQDLKDEIEGVLAKKADGMFRWVQCQLDRLNDCYSLGDVRMVLDTLPETLYETYDQMLRAMDRKPFGRTRARRALAWLATVLVPLTLEQLAAAMSINLEKPALDHDNAPMDETVMLDILGSLVTISKYRKIITLSHYSVKEYLTSDDLALAGSSYFVHRPTASLELVTVSIFSIILFSDKSETAINASDLPSYAASHGLRHLADCHSDDDHLLVRHLLILQHHICAYGHVYKPNKPLRGWMLRTQNLALYIILRYGYTTLLEHYVSHCPVGAEEDNPLVFAALYSDPSRTRILIRQGLNVNLEGVIDENCYVRKMSPLTAAARNEIEEHQGGLVDLLIENGCLVTKDVLHRVFGCNLGAPCKPVVVRALLGHGADPQFRDAYGRTCLHMLLNPWDKIEGPAPEDAFEIARMLVIAGCDPMAPDVWNTSSLCLVIQHCFLEFVEWLCQRGFRLPPDAILLACSGRDTCRELLPMLQFLVRNGARAGIHDDHGSNALHLFLEQSSMLYRPDIESIKSIIELLVKHGCNINGRNDAGVTPLQLAAASYIEPKSDILDFFFSLSAELPVEIINYVAESGWTRSQSVLQDLIATVRFLVNTLNASCQAKTIDGNNALHSLLKQQHFESREPEALHELVAFFVENGCDVHTLAASGETPLQVAIENGHLDLACNILWECTETCFVDHTTSYHGDSEGNGILHRLCNWNSRLEDKVKLLCLAGYEPAKDINRPNKKGLTPLCIILTHSDAEDEAIISLLLDLGASFDHVNYLDMERLEWAANLPWYPDAHRRHLTLTTTTTEDVIAVCCLLRAKRLSFSIARTILDMAGCWACINISRNNIRYTGKFSGCDGLISLPMVSGGGAHAGACWVPRRLVFTCKIDSFIRYDYPIVSILVLVRRQSGSLFIVPVCLENAEFDVWDEFTPAGLVGGKERLAVEELTHGDALCVDFIDTTDDYVTLEFFRVEIYYAMKSDP